jgi:hypothetical protein
MAGRYRDNVRLWGPFAVKIADEPQVERRLMRDVSVFSVGVSIRGVRVMLRGAPTTAHDLIEGLRLLERAVWSKSASVIDKTWREQLLEHLSVVYPSARVAERIAALQPPRWTSIHGDATVANLIRYPVLGLRWIDPLYRDYIPGDPFVDVGKMLQSCWNYEGVLCGERPAENRDLAATLTCLVARTAADERDIQTWLIVHLARLLRYHTPDVQRAFREVLTDAYDCPVG